MPKTSVSDLEAMFGPVISSYGSGQAVEDGVLVEAAPDQFGPAVLFTRGVFNAIWPAELLDAQELTDEPVKHADGRTYLQRAVPLIQDALMICKAKPTRNGAPEDLWTEGLEGNVTGREVWIQANDRGGITLMFPEDY